MGSWADEPEIDELLRDEVMQALLACDSLIEAMVRAAVAEARQALRRRTAGGLDCRPQERSQQPVGAV